MKLEILGTRGSMPIGGNEYTEYGTDTSSYLLSTDKQAIFLDAGTGICKCSEVGDRDVSIIISHMHLDHIMGLAFLPLLFEKRSVNIYADMPGNVIKQTLERLFSKPFWPCALERYPAKITYHSLGDKMNIGDVIVTTVDGFHPGGCKMIRLTYQNKSVCYVGDFEHGDIASATLEDFADNSKVLIYDGQYTAAEYEKYKGYGHSTKEMGIEIISKINVEKIIFTHHNPGHTDEFLKKEEMRLTEFCPEALVAKPGMTVIL